MNKVALDKPHWLISGSERTRIGEATPEKPHEVIHRIREQHDSHCHWRDLWLDRVAILGG